MNVNAKKYGLEYSDLSCKLVLYSRYGVIWKIKVLQSVPNKVNLLQ